jgi:L-asparaginase
MEEIFIINTGGTFNKIYNKVTGNLDVDDKNLTLKEIEKKLFTKLNYKNIINKDSLEFNNKDRKELCDLIKSLKYEKIVVIHGTDTIDLSAKEVFNLNLDKTIVFTGAMVPFFIDKVEATANLAFALGFCKNAKGGVYIAIDFIADDFRKVIKNKALGVFEKKV